MKALSVRQPWALHINDGRKKLEFRTWTTSHRGELLICASKHDSGVWVEVEVDGKKQVLPAPLGCQMCVVELLDVRPATREEVEADGGEWSPGLYAWVFGDVFPVEPAPVSGRLHLFDVPEDQIFPLRGEALWCDFEYEGRRKKRDGVKRVPETV